MVCVSFRKATSPSPSAAQFDRNGKYEVRREWVSKDKRIFTLYQSEAFNNSLSVKWDGVSVDMEKGMQKRSIKKMIKFQMLLLLLAVLLGVFNLFRGGVAASVPSADLVSITNYVVCVSSNKRGAFKYFSRSCASSEYVLCCIMGTL